MPKSLPVGWEAMLYFYCFEFLNLIYFFMQQVLIGKLHFMLGFSSWPQGCFCVACQLRFFFFFNLFWLHWVVGCLQLRQVGAILRCGARTSHCGGFSCFRAQALGAWASVVVACGFSSCGSRDLECRLSSCGARDQLLHGMWDLPRPEIEPVSPTLAGGFLTAAPPGKSQEWFLFQKVKQNNK